MPAHASLHAARATAVIETGVPTPFRHEALLFGSDAEFAARTGAFLAVAVDAGEPAIAVLDSRKSAAVRKELGARRTEAVTFVDADGFGRNPSRVMDAWRSIARAHAREPRIRGVAEPIMPFRTPVERDECRVEEALMNLALADSRLWLMCAYDTSRLPSAAIDRVAQSHRYVHHHDRTHESEAMCAPEELIAQPLPEPVNVESESTFDATALHDVRTVVAEHATAAGFDNDRVVGLVLAASEVATNSILHGGGHGRLRCWNDDVTTVCEVSDHGRLEQPLAGRIRPDAGQPNGYGLWVAEQLCDLVQIRSGSGWTVVRLALVR